MTLTLYCNQGDMERLFSAAGVTSFADHDEDTVNDTGVVTDCLNRAAEEINLFAMQYYSAAALATSTLVNRWATVFACCFLCELRGNEIPTAFQNEFTAIQEKLEQIATGDLKIPGLAYSEDFRPSIRNVHIDRRYWRDRVRVIPQRSGVPTLLPEDTTPSYGVPPYGY